MLHCCTSLTAQIGKGRYDQQLPGHRLQNWPHRPRRASAAAPSASTVAYPSEAHSSGGGTCSTTAGGGGVLFCPRTQEAPLPLLLPPPPPPPPATAPPRSPRSPRSRPSPPETQQLWLPPSVRSHSRATPPSFEGVERDTQRWAPIRVLLVLCGLHLLPPALPLPPRAP